MGCVFGYVILLTFFGPEYLGRDFHVENDEDMAAAAGPTAMRMSHDSRHVGDLSDDGLEKGQTNVHEKV